MKKSIQTALVVEGGGMRGVFAAGVLDRFLEKDFDPFDAYFGVSAGACNLSSHLGKQYQRNYRCYTDYMLRPDFFSIGKYLRGGHYMDLDWFWDHLMQADPLNAAGASMKNFHITVTNIITGKAEYLRAREETIFDALKASSALPLLYRKFISIDNARYVDGGVADSIPVQEAYRQGGRRIMVIRSQPDGYNKKNRVESKLLPLLFPGYPRLRKALARRDLQYRSATGFIKHPPEDAEIIEICPDRLHSGRTTRDRALLELDYAEGRRVGLEAIQRWETDLR
jgi:predicted patatin/cPLA2 family phospholipase